ncbi:MAG: tetratricopeptide repeat protein, partial [Candidatus Latescibacteria bacterium]|nr:tetratricopeptide repeat protein [Candidatus Latescibacterota bacterium]
GEGRLTMGRKTYHATAKLLVAAVFLTTACGTAFADKAARYNKKGVEAFKEQSFDESASHFMDAVVENPDAPELRFNLGTALSEKKETEEALKQLNIATQGLDAPKMKAAALFNAGNTNFLAGNLEAAIDEYKQALRFDQESRDIRQNLELAIRKYQQQQKQKNDKDKKEDGKNKKDNDKDKQDEQNGKNNEKKKNEEKQNNEEKKNQTENSEENKPEDQQQQPSSQDQSESRPMSMEEAKRILDALSDEEKKALSLRRMQMQTDMRQGDDW